MAYNNRSLNSNKPLFSTLEDDDDIASAFMNSSSATYLAADRLPQTYDDGKMGLSPEERQRNELLLQMRQVEERTLDSCKRSQGLLVESEKIGIETAEDLCRQREQLSNTENRLDDINSTLKDTQKNINGIKSVFSSLKQWWTTPKKPPADGKESDATSPVSPSSISSDKSQPPLTDNLSSAVETSQLSLQFSSQSHPALRLKGLEEENTAPELSSDFRSYSKKVDQQLDEDLSMMSSGLSRLKDLAKGLGTEIEDQNSMLDRIQTKTEKADMTINNQNTQIKRILKR